MDKLIGGLTLSDIANVGALLVFMVFVMATIWKFIPTAIQAINGLSGAWRENTAALQALKEEINSNRNNCAFIQGEVKDDVCSIEIRIGQKIDELKGICITALRNAEETNTILKHSAKKG